MIKSLSPYYVTIPFVSPLTDLTCTKYTLEIYIWNGERSLPPEEPSYSITKTNPTGSTLSDEINIANLISDYISFTPQEGTGTELINGNNQYWIKYQTFYKTSNSLDLTTPTNITTEIFTKGYGYGMDGKNSQTPTNKILLQGSEFKVSRNSVFVLPIEIEKTTIPAPSITIEDITLVSGVDYEITFSYVGTYDLSFILTYNEGTDSYVELISTTSPVIFDIVVTDVEVSVQLTGYDLDSNTTVYSNIFNVIIP